MVSMSHVNTCLVAACSLGLLLSVYAFTVEVNYEKDDNYEAMCDISEHMSCTKAFSSEYGRGFGLIGPWLGEDHFLNVPNSLYGILYYQLLMLLANFTNRASSIACLVLTILSCISSVYFAYILYFILFDLCIVCVGTYIINLTCLCLAIVKLRKCPKKIKEKVEEKAEDEEVKELTAEPVSEKENVVVEEKEKTN